MDELHKVMRVIQKKQPDAPHECLLVLDSTIGQNALSQANGFTKAAPLTGVVLTKLDGTAKGGVVLAVKNELGIPVRLVGLGEQADDLQDFNREFFVDAILGTENQEEETV
jgi:fused signal recognition particle receptor